MYKDVGSTFSRALLTAVFIGFFDTLICLTFNIIYRNETGYMPSMLINVSSIIFVVNFLFMCIGMLYYVFQQLFGRKDIVFELVTVLAVLFLAWRTELGHRFEDQLVNNEFKGLLLGVLIIVGVGIAAIPFMFRSKLVEKYVI